MKIELKAAAYAPCGNLATASIEIELHYATMDGNYVLRLPVIGLVIDTSTSSNKTTVKGF